MQRKDVDSITERTIEKNEVFAGRIFTAYNDRVLLPNGAEAAREYVSHHGGVCVAAINEKDELAFVRQYRYAYSSPLLELPAGKLEKGEQPDEAIKRELAEETGAVGRNWRSLGKLYPTPGYCDEIISLYACDIESTGSQSPDEDECLELIYIPFGEAVRMALRGELPDAKTQVIILKLAAQRAGLGGEGAAE